MKITLLFAIHNLNTSLATGPFVLIFELIATNSYVLMAVLKQQLVASVIHVLMGTKVMELYVQKLLQQQQLFCPMKSNWNQLQLK